MQRFWSKVERGNGCWVWTAAIGNHGYGVFGLGSKTVLAHRWAYVDCNGSIPDGYEVDHLCKNRACVRPDHLEAVPQAVNNARSNSLSASSARKSHCINGHLLDGENTYRYGSSRYCRSCKRVRDASYRRRVVSR